MPDREIEIPKLLAELHGRRARLSSIMLVYAAGALAAAVFVVALLPQRMEPWRLTAGGLVMFDIAGGVVANLSTSTNQYYQAERRLRIPFLLLHVLQPLVLYLVFPQYPAYFVSLYVFTMAAALAVNAVGDRESQQNLAAFLVVTGVLGSVFFHLETPVLYSLAPLFMIKLILGFSVRRPSFQADPCAGDNQGACDGR